MIRPLVLFSIVGALALSACTDSDNRIAYDGQYFRTKVSAIDKDRDVFVLTVKDPNKSLTGARLAAHHEGTQYCVGNFGTSDIAWDIDPLDEEAQLRIEGDLLTFQGTCPQAQRI